jgi:hypothetical protein
MQKRSDVMSLNRTLAIALVLSAAGVGAVYADDEYGTGHESLIRQSAASMPGVPLGAAQANMAAEQFGHRDIYYIPATPSWARSSQRPQYATSASLPPARDLVGDGGAQDALARAIHHPGSGTDW